MNAEDWSIQIGEVVSTFGLRGEVKVVPYTDYPEHFEELVQVCLRRPGGDSRICRIERVRPHQRILVIKFAEIDSIEAAEAVRCAGVFMRESDLMPLAENEYYIHDIVGLRVVTTEGDDLGTVKEVLRSPGNDVYVTDSVMIPAVREYVVSIDLEQKTMVVVPIHES